MLPDLVSTHSSHSPGRSSAPSSFVHSVSFSLTRPLRQFTVIKGCWNFKHLGTIQIHILSDKCHQLPYHQKAGSLVI